MIGWRWAIAAPAREGARQRVAQGVGALVQRAQVIEFAEVVDADGAVGRGDIRDFAHLTRYARRPIINSN